MAGLAEQECPIQEGSTWQDYFRYSAKTDIIQIQVLLDYAADNNIELTDKDAADVNEQFNTIEETAKSFGYDNADELYSLNYGTGVTVEIARQEALRGALAQKAYSEKQGSLKWTDQELEEHYISMGGSADNNYPTVSVRHILVKAKASEDGIITDEAKETARLHAEEILAEYEAGEKTEESFAALAQKYSEDSLSNKNGGLEENVGQGQMLQEFNDFCFDDHQPGDTGIVYCECNSYTGYHVIYYVGECPLLSNVISKTSLEGETMAKWLNSPRSAKSQKKKGFL